MIRPADSAIDAPGARRRSGRLDTALLVALLALVAARATLSEPPFREAPLKAAGGYSATVHEEIYSPSELTRVASAVAILALAAAWAVALAARRGPRRLIHPMFGVWLVLLAVCLLLSASRAADRREGFNAALEQTSLLTGALLAMQLACAAWQRRLVLVVLAAVAVMLGLKGLYQVTLEIPLQIEQYEANRTEILRGMGIEPDSPGARMFETRVYESTTKGWFGQANVFGSLVILVTLAGIGLAVDRWRYVREAAHDPDPRTAFPARGPRRRAGRSTGNVATPASPRAGEIPTPVLAAGLLTVALLPAVLAWWWTGSFGAIAAGMAGAAATVVVWLRRAWAARHRGTLLTATAAVLLAGLAALAAIGVARGTLPSGSLRVRWLYWSTAGRIAAENPLLGVGPGNFPDAYVVARPPGAEEEVKNPHNVIVQAVTEYGVPGGLVFLSLLAGLLVLAAGPRRQQDDPLDPPAPGPAGATLAASAVFAMAAVWRLAATRYPDAGAAIADNLVPLAGLAIGLAVALWTGRGGAGSLGERPGFAAVAWGCGLAAFALHNLTDFALFQPGAATAFWVAGGAFVAGTYGRRWTLSRPAAVALAALAVGGALAAGVGVLRPVWAKTDLVRQAALALAAGDLPGATRRMEQAVQVDPLDGETALDAANLHVLQARRSLGAPEPALEAAERYASRAFHRSPRSAAALERYYDIAAYQLDPSLLQASWNDTPPDPTQRRAELQRAAAQEPNDPFLLNELAQAAYLAGDYPAAADALERAHDLTGGRWPLLWDHLGDVYARAGRPDDARRAWLEFLRPRLARRDEWGNLALNATRDLLALDPQDMRLRLRLAERNWHAGRTDLAMELLRAAREMNQALDVKRLTQAELREIELLETKIRAMDTPVEQGTTAPAPATPSAGNGT